jgi:hypothetical protein
MRTQRRAQIPPVKDERIAAHVIHAGEPQSTGPELLGAGDGTECRQPTLRAAIGLIAYP